MPGARFPAYAVFVVSTRPESDPTVGVATGVADRLCERALRGMMTGVMTEPTIAVRERIVEAASDLTIEQGWSAITMEGVAQRVGVSVQTLHDEVGTKAQLAECLVLWELGRFLGAVNTGFDDNPDDLVGATRDAVRRVLERAAAASPLLRAALSVSEDGDSGLLPLLTTDSSSIAGAAAVVLELRIAEYDHGIDPLMLGALVDMVVRLVVSHVIRPSASPQETSEVIAWVVERVLRSHS